MSDVYTLVIPTYNRSGQLAALLRYLERNRAAFPVLVLDSSGPDHRQRNRDMAKRLSLALTYVEYDHGTRPFDKFRDGIGMVKTDFCGLCADDDLVIIDGLTRCVEHLAQHPELSAAHGYYFSFVEPVHDPRAMDLTGILYYTPDIASDDSVERLRDLFRNYQALTYATFRTGILRRIFDVVRPVESLLARELLSSALAVVFGKAARLPCFTNGRSLSPSEPYRHWHPLEWLIESPEGLFAEYVKYREILVGILREVTGNQRSAENIGRAVDLIHMFYLVRHAPLDAYDFLMDHVLAGDDLGAVWPADEVQLPLIEASRFLPGFFDRPHGAQADGVSGVEQHRLLSFLTTWRGRAAAWSGKRDSTAWPKKFRTARRQYLLHQNFCRPTPSDLFNIGDGDIRRLLAVLDTYGPEVPQDLATP